MNHKKTIFYKKDQKYGYKSLIRKLFTVNSRFKKAIKYFCNFTYC